MRLAWLLLVGTMSVAAVGCGGSVSSGTSTPRTSAARAGAVAPAGTVEVTEREWSISVGSSAAKPGTYVLHLRNSGSLTHALAVSGPGVASRSGNVAPGGTASLRVELARPGTYTLYCPIDSHRARGMEARLTIGAPPAPATPTVAPQMGGGGY